MTSTHIVQQWATSAQDTKHTHRCFAVDIHPNTNTHFHSTLITFKFSCFLHNVWFQTLSSYFHSCLFLTKLMTKTLGLETKKGEIEFIGWILTRAVAVRQMRIYLRRQLQQYRRPNTLVYAARPAYPWCRNVVFLGCPRKGFPNLWSWACCRWSLPLYLNVWLGCSRKRHAEQINQLQWFVFVTIKSSKSRMFVCLMGRLWIWCVLSLTRTKTIKSNITQFIYQNAKIHFCVPF